MLAAQFGCAVLPTRTTPALITTESVDRIVIPEKIDGGRLKDLIAELKGKIDHYHHGDPGFSVISDRVERLDSLRGDREALKLRTQNKGMFYGAIILPLSTLGIITAWDIKAGGGGDPVGIGLLYYIWFLGLVPQALAGGLAGGWIANGTTGPYATAEFKGEIRDIITTYNDMVTKKHDFDQTDGSK